MTPEVEKRIRQISNGEIPKGYKKTAAGIIPEDWQYLTIKECLVIKNNERIPISEEVRKTIPGPFPYYGPTQAQGHIGSYNSEGQAVLIGEDGDHFLKYKEKPMTLLVDGKYTVNNHAHIVAGTQWCLAKWFFYIYQHKSLLSVITRQGAGRYKLTKEALEKQRIQLPRIEEQKKIIEILATQDKVIELQQTKIDKLIKLKKSYFVKLFPRRGAKVPEFRCKGFNGDWEQRKIGDLCQTSRLSINPQDEADSWFYEYSMPAFDAGNGPDFVLGKTMNSTRLVIKEPCILFNKLNVRKRRVWYVDKLHDKSVCSEEFVPLFSHKIDLSLLKQILISDKVTEDMEATSSGTSNSQKRVHPSAIMDYKIVIPSDVAEQKAISDFMLGLDNTIVLHQRKLEQEKQKKKALMQLLLTGIVRV